MSKIETAVSWIVNIANDESHGYDQINRWGPDYDCSSLVISAWEYAGVPVKTNGAQSTLNMRSVFLQCGFSDVTSKINLATGSGLVRGDVLLNIQNHTALYIGNNQTVAAHYNENRGITGGIPGDQSREEISVGNYYNFPWDCILRYTAENGGSSGDGTGSGTTTQPTLSSGSSGTAVKTMQKKLMMLGFSCGSAGADGDFGSGTLTAVKNFQAANGLSVDGICGPATHAKLDTKYNALGVFTATCNLQDLKVRTGAGTENPVFAQYPKLNKGETVLVAKKVVVQTTPPNWYFALVGDRYTAYISARYMV